MIDITMVRENQPAVFDRTTLAMDVSERQQGDQTVATSKSTRNQALTYGPTTHTNPRSEEKKTISSPGTDLGKDNKDNKRGGLHEGIKVDTVGRMGTYRSFDNKNWTGNALKRKVYKVSSSTSSIGAASLLIRQPSIRLRQMTIY